MRRGRGQLAMSRRAPHARHGSDCLSGRGKGVVIKIEAVISQRGLRGVEKFVCSAEYRLPTVIAKCTRGLQSDECRPLDLIRWDKSVTQISLVHLTGWL